jgi:hypothetical protein
MAEYEGFPKRSHSSFIEDKGKTTLVPIKRKREISSIVHERRFYYSWWKKTSESSLFYIVCNFTPHSK